MQVLLYGFNHHIPSGAAALFRDPLNVLLAFSAPLMIPFVRNPASEGAIRSRGLKFRILEHQTSNRRSSRLSRSVNPLLPFLRFCDPRCRISPRSSISNVAKGSWIVYPSLAELGVFRGTPHAGYLMGSYDQEA
jgi:hypothetical protein